MRVRMVSKKEESQNEEIIKNLELNNKRTLVVLRIIIPTLLLINLAIWEVI